MIRYVSTAIVVVLLGACVAPSSDHHDTLQNTLSESRLYIENGGNEKEVIDTLVEIEGVRAKVERDNTRHDAALHLSFEQAWQGKAFLRANSPLDLSSTLSSHALSFDLRVENVSKAGLQVAVECGVDCHNVVDIWPQALAWQGKGWQHVAIPLHCFDSQYTNFSALTTPFKLHYYGTGEVSVADINIRKEKGNILCPSQDMLSVTPAPLRAFWADEWWMTRHQQKLVETGRKEAELLVVGDSITHGWENTGSAVWQRYFSHIPTLNLGFGGDRTENVLWRIEHGALEGISPKLIVMMIGTNNTGHRMDRPENIAKGISRILDEFARRLPDSQVLLLGIFPRGEHPDVPERRNNAKTNALLVDLAKRKGVDYANFNAIFLNEKGQLSTEIMPDLLHPNAEGYRRWAAALSPYFTPIWGSSIKD